ncbi:MAG: 3-phenylpropionate/cinnamic acid dioxygenase subunit beta [Proteobacteria bacterium]|jgi:ethylbenzene dioxygenase beta subunit|nr:3-phenylpropionate/cinnamic acid dioxygenase subunit beta [Pseudomonadota bacterium]
MRNVGSMLSVEHHLALQQQLIREARLLDEESFDDWLALLNDDVRYRLPLAERRFRKDRSAPSELGSGYIFDDTKQRLRLRINRLQSGYLWAEDPRNCVRRVISNIEIWQADDNQAEVFSVVTIHRSRLDGFERQLTAGRRDRWQTTAAGWQLVLRDIQLDNAVVMDSNLNVFF